MGCSLREGVKKEVDDVLTDCTCNVLKKTKGWNNYFDCPKSPACTLGQSASARFSGSGGPIEPAIE